MSEPGALQSSGWGRLGVFARRPLRLLGQPLSRADNLGLRWALSDRLLPVLVAAMTFLAALALAAFVAAASLGRHWEQGAEAILTVQVPQPDAPAPMAQAAALATARPEGSKAVRVTRLDRVLTVLRVSPGVVSARALSADELASLLRPWLGPALGGMALPIPAVIDVRLDSNRAVSPELAAQVDSAAPGAVVESHGAWVRRLTVLARSLQACSGGALLVVMAVGVAVVAVATRAGLAARREAIEIVHGLGATDGYIAGCFAQRALVLAGVGGVAGALAALPILLWLAALAAPFTGLEEGGLSETARGMADFLTDLPSPLWVALLVLPIAAAAIGWLTAQGTVRRWLRQLP